VTLSSGGNSFEALGRGFTLLSFDGDAAVAAAFEQAAADLRIPLNVVRDTRHEGREAYEAAFVLVRPDQYVVWAGEQPPVGAAAVLGRTTGRG
jgi:hypothetical protein